MIVVYTATTHSHVERRHSPDSIGGQNKFGVKLTPAQGQAMAANAIEVARKSGDTTQEGSAKIYEGKVGGIFYSAGSKGEDTVRVVTQPLSAITDPAQLSDVAKQLSDPKTVAAVGALATTDKLGSKAPAVEVVVTQYPIREEDRKTGR